MTPTAKMIVDPSLARMVGSARAAAIAHDVFLERVADAVDGADEPRLVPVLAELARIRATCESTTRPPA